MTLLVNAQGTPLRPSVLPGGTTLFVPSREPDPRWTARLREVFPIQENRAYPEIVWEAGDDETIEHEGKPLWLGIQRWVIYEMAPKALAYQLGIDDLLDGPWQPNEIVSRTQWQLWRSHGRYGVPSWVIEGDNGGHKLRFSPREVETLKLLGVEHPEPPIPGSLPYAPFDERVVAKLVEAYRLAQIQSKKSYRQLRDEEERAFREAQVKWLGEQINRELASDVAKAIDKLDIRTPLSTLDTDFSREVAEAEQAYIETGDPQTRMLA